MSESYNPLMEINTSFVDYLDERARSYQEHVVGGTLDYAFDADFAMRQKIGGITGWSRLYKAIVSTDIPARFKKYFQSSDAVSAIKYPRAYDAVRKCSERLQISLPSVLVKKAGEIPEIMSLAGESIEPCIVISADLAEGCSYDELCYLIGCECGRLQNRHTAFNYAFTYPGISRGNVTEAGPVDENDKSNIREINYVLNKWILSGDMTADRAGVICLDNPADFPQIYASVRRRGVPDSLGNQNKDIDIAAILKNYEVLHVTPVRDMKMGDCSTDERRIAAAMEFIGCEILYIWRQDLSSNASHVGSKQSLEIRCEIIANIDGGH